MRPAVFADLPFAAARTVAGKLVVVDATAVWCEPCKLMDRTTGSAPEVVAWIAEHAVAIQIDVDREKELARELGIRSMPTLVVFRNGHELDRASGVLRPAELLAWLEAVAGGQTERDALVDAIAARPTDIEARWRLAALLVRRGDDTDATEALVWFWRHALEHRPSFLGVRGSYALELIRVLCARSTAARERFAALRDEHVAELGSAEPSPEALRDWTMLSEALGDADAIVRWAENAPDDVLARPALLRVVQSHVVPHLARRKRWDQVCRAFPDPSAILERERAVFEKIRAMPATPDFEVADVLRSNARTAAERLRRIQRALEETGQIERARAFAAEIDTSPFAEGGGQ